MRKLMLDSMCGKFDFLSIPYCKSSFEAPITSRRSVRVMSVRIFLHPLDGIARKPNASMRVLRSMSRNPMNLHDFSAPPETLRIPRLVDLFNSKLKEIEFIN